MKINRVLSPAMVMLIFANLHGVSLAADSYKIDPGHSVVGFSAQHLMISHVDGNFTDFWGTVVYDEKDSAKSSVEVHIKTASLDTRNPNRDKDVKSSLLLDVDRFPEIVFKSTRVEKTANGHVAHGQLTIHGVTEEVVLPFTVSGPIKDPSGNSRIGAQAELTINRQHYGVSFNKSLDGGGVLIGDEVKIELAVEAVKK